jgi:glycosyltransferase involved in cell wall biosynthesis
MRLSIVGIFYDMQREAARTLRSLSEEYQADVTDSYEVIAIDNGSTAPLHPATVQAMGANFRYRFFPTDSVSPSEAVNHGVGMAKGEFVAVIVDGARMATPGLVAKTLAAASSFREPFVCSLSWHLGPKVQNWSILEGYDQAEEDRLLASIDWQANGYDLFTIATIAPSSSSGYFSGVPTECSWLCLRRKTFHRLGGFDPRFRSPGGGLVSHDFRNRALQVPGIIPVMILGEGVFHQIHGGVSTNVRCGATIKMRVPRQSR